MPRHYATDDLDVSVVATLLGCKPASGLTNRMNELAKSGAIEDGDTYGWIVKQVLEAELSRLVDVTRKPRPVVPTIE